MQQCAPGLGPPRAGSAGLRPAGSLWPVLPNEGRWAISSCLTLCGAAHLASTIGTAAGDIGGHSRCQCVAPSLQHEAAYGGRGAVTGPVELIGIFGAQGERIHLHI